MGQARTRDIEVNLTRKRMWRSFNADTPFQKPLFGTPSLDGLIFSQCSQSKVLPPDNHVTSYSMIKA